MIYPYNFLYGFRRISRMTPEAARKKPEESHLWYVDDGNLPCVCANQPGARKSEKHMHTEYS